MSERRDPGQSTSPNLYHSIVEHVPEILVLLSATGKIVYVNPHTKRVLGYSLDEVKGRDIFEFLHPADVHRATQEYRKTIQQEGEGVPSVLRIRDCNGEWVPFEIIAKNCLHDPDTRAVIFTARDLRFRKELESAIVRANADTEAEVAKRTTELTKINAELRIENQARRHAESQLHHAVSLLHATLDSTADGILVVSLDGKVTSYNKKFAEMWRLDSSSSIENDDQILLSRVSDQLQSPRDFLDRVWALYAEPTATSFDVLHFKDGRIFERYSQPQRLNARITGRVWSFRDVTRPRNIEAELHQYQKMEALGKLAGGVAHDFNNLLMLISGYATELKEKLSHDEERELCEQILSITMRAASVTKQLLTFSRKQPEAPVVADLNLIVLNLEPMLRRLLSDHIQLEVSLTVEPQLIRVDVSQIETMIMNLAVNAHDAMPEGGRLSISTAGESSTDEEEHNSQSFAVLQVSDTGHGMSADVQAHIFEPFYTTKQLGRGTGLGLSTVLGIAQRSGGRVEVRSEPNHGATFQVYIPKTDVAVQAAGSAADLPPCGGTESILLAEDEPGIRSMTRTYLESLGYRVLEAADGSEAIARSFEYAGPIHLVVTDILMPKRRGDSAVKVIRSHRPGIKAIYISGYADADLAEEPDGILYKPFGFPELGRRVRAVLDASPARGACDINPAAD